MAARSLTASRTAQKPAPNRFRNARPGARRPGSSIALPGSGGRRVYHYGMLLGMPTQQIAVRLPEELLERVDELIEAGVYESRAAAVRAGLEVLADLARRRALDDAIIDGYRRVPPTRAERASALASLHDAIEEEPW